MHKSALAQQKGKEKLKQMTLDKQSPVVCQVCYQNKIWVNRYEDMLTLNTPEKKGGETLSLHSTQQYVWSIAGLRASSYFSFPNNVQ